MPRPSDIALQRQAELDRQTQQRTPVRLESVTIGVNTSSAKRAGGIKNNLKTIDLRRTGRRG